MIRSNPFFLCSRSIVDSIACESSVVIDHVVVLMLMLTLMLMLSLSYHFIEIGRGGTEIHPGWNEGMEAWTPR